MAELAGVLVGNYFLLECIAREGIVETYRARPTTKGGYDVVLRLFRPQFPDPTAFREHFASEVEKVWRCHHEHIMPLLEFGTGDDLLYCATLFSEAETLEQYLERQQGRLLPIAQVLRLMTQLCSAVQYAHEQGIVHGNIQPSSIFVRHGDDVLLSNFAMRRAYQEDEPLVAQLDEGNSAYTAPEQGLGMVRPASDIYSLGVLLYRLLGGTLPYNGDASDEITLKHGSEPIPSLRTLRPELPDAVEFVVRVALSKTPETRFPGANALAQALLASVVADSPPTVFATPQRRIHVLSKRTPFTWARAVSLLALIMLLLGLASAALFIFSSPQRIYDLSTHSFWGGGQLWQSGNTPVSHLSTATPTSPTKPRTPTTNPVTGPGAPGLPGHKPPTPTVGVAQTPIPGTTVTSGPPVTPTASPRPVACTSGSLTLDGSPSLEPLLQQAASDYQAACPGLSISLNGNGGRFALKSLQQGQIDMASSDVTARPTWNFTDHPVVGLLYAVIVSPDVHVNELSSSSLQDIYQGRVTNWSQIGGPNEAITVILPPIRDQVNAIFRTFVLNDQPEHVNGLRLKKDALVAQVVSQMPGAISYVPLMQVQGATVQVVAIDGVAPSIDALEQGTYAFWSVEHLYTQGDGTPQALAYMQFLSTAREADGAFGAVPINMLQQDVLASHLPGPQI